MYGLTLTRPWPLAFLRYGKRWENRSWRVPAKLIGERIALHAGLKYSEEDAVFIARIAARIYECDYWEVLADLHHEPYKPGTVVATVRVGVDLPYSLSDVRLVADPYAFGPRCWKSEKLFELPTPIPCRGHQRLWHLPPEVEAQIRAVGAA